MPSDMEKNMILVCKLGIASEALRISSDNAINSMPKNGCSNTAMEVGL
jgi:hypothetical protein